MGRMEVIRPALALQRPSPVPVVAGTILWTVAIVGGVVLGVLLLTTPLLAMLMPPPRADAAQTVTAMVVWSAALVAPAGLVLVGLTRLARILGGARRRIPRTTALEAVLETLPADVILARGLTLPDGRGVSDILVGPFGVAVVRELPPSSITRIRNGRWELRTRRGWLTLESPLDRAARDAERVRRWLGHDDTDFVVKTYAAVIGAEASVARTANCAVLTHDQLGSWIAALPAQRSLTPGRRERIVEIVRAAAR